jgi:hypothetical protein
MPREIPARLDGSISTGLIRQICAPNVPNVAHRASTVSALVAWQTAIWLELEPSLLACPSLRPTLRQSRALQDQSLR